jgi:hypothetical protein
MEKLQAIELFRAKVALTQGAIQALEDCTQEINYILHMWNCGKGGFFKDSDEMHVCLATAAALGANDKMYMLSGLLALHADNMRNMAKMILSETKEPSAQRKKELDEEWRLLPRRYMAAHEPILMKYLNEWCDEADGDAAMQK